MLQLLPSLYSVFYKPKCKCYNETIRANRLPTSPHQQNKNKILPQIDKYCKNINILLKKKVYGASLGTNNRPK